MEILIIKICAIIVASFLGHYPIKYLMGKIGGETEDKKAAAWVGCLERGMYAGAWFLGYPAFFGIWLAAKVVGRWSEEKESRTRLSKFMFGAGLSISIAVIVALLADWIIGNYF
jgi:hypothetical protein